MLHKSSNVTEYLLEGKEGSQCALQFLRHDCSYGELRARSAQIARSLFGKGVPGDRAVLIGENSAFWVSAYLGIMRAGLVCVPLPASVKANDLDHILRITEARIVFAQVGFAARHAQSLAGLHLMTDGETADLPGVASLESASAVFSAAPESRCDWPQHGPDDLAALMFTSGSTGQPRGVMVSHSNIIANTESIIESLCLTKSDRIMTVLPFHYCFGTSLLHTHLRVGGSLVVDSRFMYPETVLQRMIETECTGFAGVPSHFQILLRASSLNKKKFPRLRYVQQAGGRLAPSFVAELRQALPATKVYVMYGQTEATARLSCLPPELLDEKLGSIGKGLPGVKLRVLDESGRDVYPGEVGEIVATGENVTMGYWSAPEESASSFRSGNLYTGDLATVDEDGFIYIVDRAKDFLKCGGERISCGKLEEQLLEFEELLEAAVIGIPDPVLGEAAKAFVVPRVRDGAGFMERVERFCRERLPPRLVPRQIVVVATLPKNSAGKVSRTELSVLS
ncbi:MAG: AMP-binding protein [Bryobacteraceae bacterium]